MKKLKIRKVGNSLGSIFPKEWHLKAGNELPYHLDKKRHQVIIDLSSADLQHDRQLIEASFQDFKAGKWIGDQEMKQKFGKFGWGK